MGIISIIRSTAKEVGITAVITNSASRLESQLNRNTDLSDLPMMLINWDLTTNYEFNEHGFLNNPQTPVTCLLMSKADDIDTPSQYEETAELMQDLFTVFIQKLYLNLTSIQTNSATPAITSASSILVPKHGLGKHSGVVGRWTMKSEITNCT